MQIIDKRRKCKWHKTTKNAINKYKTSCGWYTTKKRPGYCHHCNGATEED